MVLLSPLTCLSLPNTITIPSPVFTVLLLCFLYHLIPSNCISKKHIYIFSSLFLALKIMLYVDICDIFSFNIKLLRFSLLLHYEYPHRKFIHFDCCIYFVNYFLTETTVSLFFPSCLSSFTPLSFLLFSLVPPVSPALAPVFSMCNCNYLLHICTCKHCSYLQSYF